MESLENNSHLGKQAIPHERWRAFLKLYLHQRKIKEVVGQLPSKIQVGILPLASGGNYLQYIVLEVNQRIKHVCSVESR